MIARLIDRLPAPWATLVWLERRQCRLAHDLIIAVGLLVVLVLPVADQPGWIIALGSIGAVLLAWAAGSGPVLDGSLAFWAAQPATARQRYLAVLLAHGGTLAVLTGIGMLMIACETPMWCWRLVAEAGFVRPYPTAAGPQWWSIRPTTPS